MQNANFKTFTSDEISFLENKHKIKDYKNSINKIIKDRNEVDKAPFNTQNKCTFR